MSILGDKHVIDRDSLIYCYPIEFFHSRSPKRLLRPSRTWVFHWRAPEMPLGAQKIRENLCESPQRTELLTYIITLIHNFWELASFWGMIIATHSRETYQPTSILRLGQGYFEWLKREWNIKLWWNDVVNPIIKIPVTTHLDVKN